MFLQKFDSLPNEKLINAYTCFLSTSAGPIAGTLFIATKRIAFASDQPLPHNPTPGQTMWSYYQVCAYMCLCGMSYLILGVGFSIAVCVYKPVSIC